MLLASFGDPGHAFPQIALGRALVRRGHHVCLQTWRAWREHVEREGMRFAAAPEYQVFPTRERPLSPYQAAVRAARETQPLVRSFAPDVVVVDILTVAAALAAEREGLPWITLVPHLLPLPDRALPPYAIGALPPRTAVGRAFWRLFRPLLRLGEERGRRELNEARRRLGLAPLAYPHGGISRLRALVATFPQLEEARSELPAFARITGPLEWEQPYPPVELPAGSEPLVLVAPSTSQDPDHRLLRCALAGLRDAPVRVLATTNRRPLREQVEIGPNTVLVDWVSYSQTMPRADLVVCHGGHGTVVRSLASGTPVLCVPAAGDMAENALRVAWAGAGFALPSRLLSPRNLRAAVLRALADRSTQRRASEFATWARANPGGASAAREVEQVVEELRGRDSNPQPTG